MMRIVIIAAFAILAASSLSQAQKVVTKDGVVSLDATAKGSPEDIKATTAKALGAITNDGTMEIAVLMNDFTFKRALMQEHFNENYVESKKFPKAVFKGKVTDFAKSVNLSKDGIYPVAVTGKMTLHGETRDLNATGTITVKGGKITNGKASFSLNLLDYKVDIPNLVRDKVNTTAKIETNLNFK
jgi:polyisoprenoid-binding protein YceI